jgi:hypothetical protein
MVESRDMVWYILHQCSQMYWPVAHDWSYANTIETLVLLVIVYDIIWHRWNAIREIERDKEAEVRAIKREEAAEKRQIRRERQEFLRKHWQELQASLILVIRVTKDLKQQKLFVAKNSNAQDPTTRALLMTMAKRFPELLAEFDDRWGRVVAQLNVFPQPRDPLALEVLTLVEELGQTVKDKNTEVKEETLDALSKLVVRVADAGNLSNLDD